MTGKTRRHTLRKCVAGTSLILPIGVDAFIKNVKLAKVMKYETYVLGEHLIDMGIHRNTLPVGWGLEAIPVAGIIIDVS